MGFKAQMLLVEIGRDFRALFGREETVTHAPFGFLLGRLEIAVHIFWQLTSS